LPWARSFLFFPSKIAISIDLLQQNRPTSNYCWRALAVLTLAKSIEGLTCRRILFEEPNRLALGN
jgi:hypothetical protein